MSNKNIDYTNKTDESYVAIPKTHLEDSRLSWEAIGMLNYVLAQPDDYEVTLDDLYQSSPAGRHKTRRIVGELISYGYFEQREKA